MQTTIMQLLQCQSWQAHKPDLVAKGEIHRVHWDPSRKFASQFSCFTAGSIYHDELGCGTLAARGHLAFFIAAGARRAPLQICHETFRKEVGADVALSMPPGDITCHHIGTGKLLTSKRQKQHSMKGEQRNTTSTESIHVQEKNCLMRFYIPVI